jgi:hypothetical protein
VYQVVAMLGSLLQTQLYAPLNTSDLQVFQLWQRLKADNARSLFNRPDFVGKYGYVFQGKPAVCKAWLHRGHGWATAPHGRCIVTPMTGFLLKPGPFNAALDCAQILQGLYLLHRS